MKKFIRLLSLTLLLALSIGVCSAEHVIKKVETKENICKVSADYSFELLAIGFEKFDEIIMLNKHYNENASIKFNFLSSSFNYNFRKVKQSRKENNLNLSTKVITRNSKHHIWLQPLQAKYPRC